MPSFNSALQPPIVPCNAARMDRALGRALYGRYSATPLTHTNHAPRVVLVVHPMLDGVALARHLTQGESFFVQSCGTPLATSRGDALGDRLHDFLVEQAGVFTASGIGEDKARVAAATRRARFFASGVFCAHWVQLAMAARVEQLAALQAMRHQGMVPQSARDYVALCTRNVRRLAAAVETVKSEFMSRTHDSEPSDAEYSAEYYTEQRSTLARVSTTIDMDVSTSMQPFVDELGQTRLFAPERHAGEAVAVPRIEVFAGAWWMEHQLLALTAASVQQELGALCRTEAMLAARVYGAENTVVVLVDPGRRRVHATLAAVHARLCRDFSHAFTVDTRCAIITQLASVCEAAWARAVETLECGGAHVLRVNFEDTPSYGADQCLSRVAACPYAHNIVQSALSTYVQRMCEGRPWAAADPSPVKTAVPGSQGAVSEEWRWHAGSGATVTVTSQGTTAGRAPVPTWEEQYTALFGHEYNTSEFCIEIASRPDHTTASGGSALMTPDEDEPDLMGMNDLC